VLAQVTDEHERILNAIEEGDPEAAQAALLDHLTAGAGAAAPLAGAAEARR
jgi:DNA-binding FadR family transcriptional regulator